MSASEQFSGFHFTYSLEDFIGAGIIWGKCLIIQECLGKRSENLFLMQNITSAMKSKKKMECWNTNYKTLLFSVNKLNLYWNSLTFSTYMEVILATHLFLEYAQLQQTGELPLRFVILNLSVILTWIDQYFLKSWSMTLLTGHFSTKAKRSFQAPCRLDSLW